jgi:asparagine synthase (glutamine-hydrolysing)
MGFIAGYFRKAGSLNSHFVEQRARMFRILSEDDLASYETTIIPIEFGHLIHRYKPAYPIKTKPKTDHNGNVLMTLGFHTKSAAENPPDSICDSAGEFVCVFYDAAKCSLHVINDRFGSRPCYFLESDGTVYFSSNLAFLLWLAQTTPEFDMLGWFQTFGCNHTVGTRTTFKGISRTPPASHVTVLENCSVDIRPYWQPRFQAENISDPLAFSQKVWCQFKAGVDFRARLVGKGLLALSGGLDSRLVAGAIPKDTDFSAFTFSNNTANAETETATRVARQLGLIHEIRPVEPSAFSDKAHDVIRLTGGMRPFHHVAIVFEYIKQMQRSGVVFLLGGGPGDILAGSKIPSVDYCDPSVTASRLREYCRKLAPDADTLETIFKRDVVRQYRSLVEQSFSESLGEMNGPTAAHKVTLWAIANRWPNFTFTSLMHTHPDVSEAFSHLDYGFADLMLKLPASWLYGRNFYSFMIYHSLPELREIIYSNSGKQLEKDLIQRECRVGVGNRALQIAQVLARAATPQAMVRVLRPAVVPRRSDPYIRDRALLMEVEQSLDNPRLRSVLSVDRARSFVKNYGTHKLRISPPGQTELMGNLATMCLAVKELAQ